MALDHQSKDQDDGRSFSKADTLSTASYSSEDSESYDALVTDSAEGSGGGNINMLMDQILNQPAPATVNVNSSSDVHIGPSLNYNAPVTINQYVSVRPTSGELEDVPLPLRIPLQPNGTGKAALSGVSAGAVGTGAGGDLSKPGGTRAVGVPWWQRRKVLAAAGALVVLLIAVGALIALLRPGSGDADGPTTDAYWQPHVPLSPLPPKDAPPDPQFTLEGGRQIIRRAMWSDVPPTFVRPLHHPTPYVVIGHTAGRLCKGEVECAPMLRDYRDEHKAKWDQPDIVYNFLIDVAGNVYEARGWDATNNYQSWAMRCNLGVTLMGNFVNYNVTERMMRSLQQLLELGVRLGKLASNYKLVAQSQVMPTLSPGKNVLVVIDSWSHRCLSDCEVGVECIYIDPRATSSTATSGSSTFLVAATTTTTTITVAAPTTNTPTNQISDVNADITPM